MLTIGPFAAAFAPDDDSLEAIHERAMAMKKERTQVTGRLGRRDFLRSTAVAAAAAFGAPSVLPSSVFGANAPSNRITLGIIGCGNQSTVDVPEWLKNDDAQIVAVCDVNKASYGYRDEKQYLGREPVREKIQAHYAKKTPSGQYKGVDAYTDFLEVIGRKDIDAVAIIVPDQWHAIMTIMAAKVGKDIYCQKPLSLTIDDGKQMVKAVRQYGRILQTGSHHRSNATVRRCCELVRNGRIGKLQRITAYVAPNNKVGPGPGWQPMPVPEGFDYEMWLGPAPSAPYHQDRCLYRFRFILDYSGGQVTNFGAHSLDIAQWALGLDHNGGPIEVSNLGAEWPEKGSLFNTATKVHFGAKYANGVELVCVTDKKGFGARFEGTEGTIEVGYNRLETTPKSIKDSPLEPNDVHLYESANHYRNFLDCVKSRKDPIAPVEVGHRTATLCHLGNIAMLLDRKVQWDPEKEVFVGDDEANKMLRRPMRAPWTL
jgi:predicted dehydrogenase